MNDFYLAPSQVSAALLRIEEKLDQLIQASQKEKGNMTVVSDSLIALQAKVQANTTELGSLTTLLGGLHDQLEAALANDDPTAALASITAISASIDMNTASMAAAVLANTPAAASPVPAVAPAPLPPVPIPVTPASTVAPTIPPTAQVKRK